MIDKKKKNWLTDFSFQVKSLEVSIFPSNENKAEQTKKLTTLIRSIKEVKTQGKPFLLRLETDN